MKYKFQTYMDISTSASSMQIISISAGGRELIERVSHFIPAYKYMKLGAVSIKMVPASTLPVDPLGLSYDADDPQSVDPRDQMNPGLIRITNGEDIKTNISGLTNDQQKGMYDAMMLDPHWFKWMLQAGCKRTATPLYWTIGQVHQDNFPGATVNVPQIRTGSVSPGVIGTTSFRMYSPNNATDGDAAPNSYRDVNDTQARGLFQTGHRGRLGYMPTDGFVPSTGGVGPNPIINSVPKINVFTIVLPKANKTRYYYRVFITQTVYFAGVRNVMEYGGIDQFVRPYALQPIDPSGRLSVRSYDLNPPNDGANQG